MSDDGTPPEGGKTDAENGGGDFKPIASQDELNRIIGERLARERARFADYDDLKAKATEFDKVAESQKTETQKAIERAEAAEKRAAEYEAKEQRKAWAEEITKDSGIPASALRGATREEMQEHFEVLKPLVSKAAPTRTHVPPGKPAEGETGSRAVAALREMRRGG